MSGKFEKYLKDYLILIDTCSMCHEFYPQFMREYEELMVKNGTKIRLTESNNKELQEHLEEGRHLDKYKDKPKEMEEKRALAQKASTAINTLFRYPNILRVLGAKEAPLFADAGIYTYISAAHVSHNVLLITQDGKLTYDVMQLRKLLSIDSYYKLECLYFSPRENDFFSKYSDKELKEIKEKAEKEKAEAQKNKKKKH